MGIKFGLFVGGSVCVEMLDWLKVRSIQKKKKRLEKTFLKCSILENYYIHIMKFM